jgi:hypothetical protein
MYQDREGLRFQHRNPIVTLIIANMVYFLLMVMVDWSGYQVDIYNHGSLQSQKLSEDEDSFDKAEDYNGQDQMNIDLFDAANLPMMAGRDLVARPVTRDPGQCGH